MCAKGLRQRLPAGGEGGHALEDVVAGMCHWDDGHGQLLLVFLQNGLEGKTSEAETALRNEPVNSHLPSRQTWAEGLRGTPRPHLAPFTEPSNPSHPRVWGWRPAGVEWLCCIKRTMQTLFSIFSRLPPNYRRLRGPPALATCPARGCWSSGSPQGLFRACTVWRFKPRPTNFDTPFKRA